LNVFDMKQIQNKVYIELGKTTIFLDGTLNKVESEDDKIR